MLPKSLTRSVSKISGKVPLRLVLVVPFIIQISATVGLVGYLSFRNGQKAVNDLAWQLRSEISQHIQENVRTYLAIPHQVNRSNAAAISLGQLNVQDYAGLKRHFWQQIQIFDSLTFAGIGLEQKDILGVERLDNGLLTIRTSTKANGYDFRTYSTNQFGKKLKLLNNKTNFDPRTRPWYKAAVAAGKPTWSDIYPNTAGLTLYLGASMPFYNKQGKLQGVLLTNINLSKIGSFLQSLKIGKTGQTFIIERSGILVATSTGEQPFQRTKKDYGAERIKATDSRNNLTRATAQYLAANFQDKNLIQHSLSLEFKIAGKREFIELLPLEDDKGLDWLIVVVIPESDFIEQINANTRSTILLCLTALAIATAVGILTSRWITQPILRLKDAATALSEGQFDQSINLERADELGVLAKAFNSMALQLQEYFTTLESKNAELQRLDKLKDEFLANTSHELRTPLNGIIGIAESLIDGVTGKLPEKTITNLVTIAASGRRLSHLVNDILDFSQLKHKNIQLQIKPVGMKEVSDVVIALSRSIVGKKLLQLINGIGSDVPLVDADENRVQQILYNLIGNAIKFTDAGVVEVSAKTVNYQQIEYLAITVADTGIGIPEDKLDRIFESFEQVDGSTARVYGGTGLGLAVTKQLVELHGGNIYVTSIVGEGSQVTFTLPISQNQIASSEGSPIKAYIQPQELADETIIAEALVANGGDFKILIVDDEQINIQVLLNNLYLQNFSVTQATNGAEALAIIENGFQPDIILLDVMMPRMTGYEVCQKIRQKFLASELPIVMLTAKNQISDLVEGFTSGANDYLTKPFSKHELLARIKTHIRLAKINVANGRFVPHEFLRFLGHESIVDVKLGDQVQKNMTILFSDIRSFTTLSEAMSPHENFNFINDYLSRVSPAIRANNGFIDKYIGDAVMALFPQLADDAVKSAIEMQKQVNLYNEYRQQKGDIPIAIGIGLHTGSLMLGTVGEPERMQGTVISDAVNLASRLEGLTKLYGAGIVISEQTLSSLNHEEQYSYRFLDRVMVQGKKIAVAVFEVYDGTELLQQLKTQTRTSFEEAVKLYYQQQFAQAQYIFQEVLQINAGDKAARLYISRCELYQKSGVPEGWSGAEAINDK